MALEDIKAWVAGLQPGDKIAVYEHHGRSFLQERVVARRTPSGRVVCDLGQTYKPDSFLYGSPTYAHRCIRPIQPKVS